MSKKIKPIGKAPDKNEQILRAIAMKRESYFQLILGNLLRNEAVTRPAMVSVSGKDGRQHEQVNIIDVIDTALEGSAYIIEKMYTANDQEGE